MYILTCIVIDDKEQAIDLLISHLQKIDYLKIVRTFNNTSDAIDFLSDNAIDLIFIDIEMPKISGIDFMKITGRNAEIIVVSVLREYKLDEVENSVLDYLLKPVQFDRLLRSVEKAIERRVPDLEVNTLVDDFIIVKGEHKNKFIRIEIADIVYIEGLKNYLSIFTSHQRVITYLNIKAIEEQLPQDKFIRIHKSYIIAINKVNYIDGNQVYLKGVEDSKPISESYGPAFFNLIKGKLIWNKKTFNSKSI